jgi:HEAT repeat protein
MIALATDRDVRTSTRRDAIFWVSQAAGEKAARGLRSILGDDSEEIELRKHAVFALSQQGTEEAVTTLLELARNSPEPELRKAAFFWLGQRDEDPRVMALFRSILLEES